MSGFLIEDFSACVTAAKKRYKDFEVIYERVATDDFWLVHEAVWYLLGIRPDGRVSTKIVFRDLDDENGEADFDLLEISLAYDHYVRLINRALLGKLIAKVDLENGTYLVSVSELMAWAKRKNLYINAELVKFLDIESATEGRSELPDEVSENLDTRRKQQHEIILAIIAALEYDPHQIPDRGKSKIKTACLTRPRLFTPDSFDHAWKDGVSAGLFRLANHEKFSPK